MVRRHPRGFTLVELLVVIAIIGILMALLLPAVNFAVENARQRTCMSNMRQMALACTSFDSSKGYFPGYTNKLAYNDAGTTKYKQVSWFIAVSKELERTDIYESWQASASPATPYVDFAVCPSDPPDSNDQPFLAYVGNAGYRNPANNTVADGIMFNAFPNVATPAVKGPSITATQVKDGVSNTLLISENIQATRYDAADQYSNCFVWWDSDDPNRRINGNKTTTTTGNADVARPSANHPGGVNVVFADGHTQWLRQDIDYGVYVQLMTSRHSDSYVQNSMSAAPAAWKTYVLSDKDYK